MIHTNLIATLLICLCSVPLVGQSIRTITVPDTSLSILVVGDWGRHGEHNQRDVARAMDSAAVHLDPVAVVSVGDNFYPDGVQSVHDHAWKVSFEDIYTAHSLHVPWIVALGNHDYHGNVQAQIDYTDVSRRWTMPARYFDTTFVEDEDDASVSVLLLVIDTNPFQTDYLAAPAGEYGDVATQDTSRQKRYIDSVLTSSKATWKIVIGHHPMYTGGKRKGKTGDMLRSFKGLFAKHRVDAYFAGHEHDLQHHVDDTGVHSFVSGAGSEVRKTGNIPETRFARSVPGFATVTASPTLLTVRFVDGTGSVIYTTSIPKRR